MNILVIGNGFDLAHDLPTRYTDFLFFCNVINSLIIGNENEEKLPKNYENYNIWIENNEKIQINKIQANNKYIFEFGLRKRIITLVDQKIYITMLNNFIRKLFNEDRENQKIIKELLYLVNNNFWIQYYLGCDINGNENWIDFESEILNVIKSIDHDMQKYDQSIHSLIDKKYHLSNIYIEKWYKNKTITYRKIRNDLHNDLNRLIRVFEIYLTEYVEKIDCVQVSPNIQKILLKNFIDYNRISNHSENYVLSFNYTNTFQRLYINIEEDYKYFEEHIDYIHGKADINNTIETNNMVLGIDEYLEKDRKNKDIEFIAFKKYYQRIHKQTGCKYKEWVDQIREEWDNETDESKAEIRKYISKGNIDNPKIHRLYIFGHSLDVTDRDILRDLILNDNVYTTIFYHNKDVMGQQIANLVKIIGQDELIRRTGGSTKTINFKQQQDMIEINS